MSMFGSCIPEQTRQIPGKPPIALSKDFQNFPNTRQDGTPIASQKVNKCIHNLSVYLPTVRLAALLRYSYKFGLANPLY